MLTYLKLADKRPGLLINFNVALINVALVKDGITRIGNGLKEDLTVKSQARQDEDRCYWNERVD